MADQIVDGALSREGRRHQRTVARGGVPVWRTGKPDAFLAAAVETARAGLLEITRGEYIGVHLGAKSEGERVVTQLFACTLPGYRGWQWFAVLARAPRAKAATVSEVGLIPSADSVLAPEWVPWSERIRPEDALPETRNAAGEGDPVQSSVQNPIVQDPVQTTAGSAGPPESRAESPAEVTEITEQPGDPGARA